MAVQTEIRKVEFISIQKDLRIASDCIEQVGVGGDSRPP